MTLDTERELSVLRARVAALEIEREALLDELRRLRTLHPHPHQRAHRGAKPE